MAYNTVGEYIRGARGINTIELMDSRGNVIEDGCMTDYLDSTIKSSIVHERGNSGFVATLVI